MPAVARAYDDIVDLFARGTPPEDLLKFRPSRQAQGRARRLLSRNKANTLTAEEADELHRLGELEHLLQLVKARARLLLDRAS